MVAFLLESKEAKRVEAVFNSLEKKISTIEFCLSFPLILTDRGGEFAHPDVLECGVDNVIRTSVYYCDPMCSWQKPHCEKNHEYIRKICPKGTSFDGYTQYDIDRMMSHINSAPRESLGGLTPYALAEMMLSKTLMKAFGLRKIAPDEVILTPDLLKK
jgi:IS30 family transposase